MHACPGRRGASANGAARAPKERRGLARRQNARHAARWALETPRPQRKASMPRACSASRQLRPRLPRHGRQKPRGLEGGRAARAAAPPAAFFRAAFRVSERLSPVPARTRRLRTPPSAKQKQATHSAPWADVVPLGTHTAAYRTARRGGGPKTSTSRHGGAARRACAVPRGRFSLPRTLTADRPRRPISPRPRRRRSRRSGSPPR